MDRERWLAGGRVWGVVGDFVLVGVVAEGVGSSVVFVVRVQDKNSCVVFARQVPEYDFHEVALASSCRCGYENMVGECFSPWEVDGYVELFGS